MQCEFCEKTEGREIEIKAYKIGETLALSCHDCAGENIMTDNLTPIDLPDDWRVIPQKKFDEMRMGNKAFEKVAQKISAIEHKYGWTGRYLYDADIASDGLEAIECVTVEDYDIIFMDLLMKRY